MKIIQRIAYNNKNNLFHFNVTYKIINENPITINILHSLFVE